MLTDPQRDFVGSYLLDCDARLAAIRSGYDLQPCTNSPKRSYVYGLIDPVNNEIFYVGKGTKRRWNAHVSDYFRDRFINQVKNDRIAAIYEAGLEVQAVFLATDLPSDEALTAEGAFIKAIGLARLTNANSYPCSPAYREKAAARQAEAAKLRSLQLLANFVHAARLLHEGLPPNDARRQFLKDTVKYTVNWEPQEAINHAAA